MLNGPALLFCPADRPDRFAKALANSDHVIVDLEDAVASNSKEAARQALVATPLDPAKVIVRLNALDSGYSEADLDAIDQTDYNLLMLPMATSREQVESLSPRKVIALCETPRGILSALQIAEASNCVGMMWGAEDLVAGLGGQSSRFAHGTYRDVARSARSTVLLAAAAAGVHAIDAVYLDIPDASGLKSEAEDAVATGFDAKACIHPTQVTVVRDAFAPDSEEVEWARGLLEAAKTQRGVFRFSGRMVDGPVFRQAELILQRHAGTGGDSSSFCR